MKIKDIIGGAVELKLRYESNQDVHRTKSKGYNLCLNEEVIIDEEALISLQCPINKRKCTVCPSLFRGCRENAIAIAKAIKQGRIIRKKD